MNQIHAFRSDVLEDLDATMLAARIARRLVHPKEVVEAAIQRAEAVNPTLNALVFPCFDQARKWAEKTDPSAYWSGIPTFIKDTDHFKGYPTQFGTGVFKGMPAKADSRFVGQYLSTGMIPLGKTTLPEFGLICSTENPKWGITCNPWNTAFTAGGSSSGSAAMVAAGVVPVAHANDGAGSTRIPASICGLVGLKPSRNRLLPADGTESMPIQIIHQGILSRSVRDTAHFYHAAELYHKNKKLPPIGCVLNPNPKRYKILAFNNPLPGSLGHRDMAVESGLIQTAQLFESAGHRVEWMDIPINMDEMSGHFLNYYGFLAYMLTRWSRFSIGAAVDRSQLEPFTEGLSLRFGKYPLRLVSSIRALHHLSATVWSLFKNYDLLLTPVLAHQTPEIGYFSPELPFEEITRRALYYAMYCGLHNVSGCPAISLPMAEDSRGLPIGIQIAAPYGQDRRLLEIAYELEEVRPFKRLGNLPSPTHKSSFTF